MKKCFLFFEFKYLQNMAQTTFNIWLQKKMMQSHCTRVHSLYSRIMTYSHDKGLLYVRKKTTITLHC